MAGADSPTPPMAWLRNRFGSPAIHGETAPATSPPSLSLVSATRPLPRRHGCGRTRGVTAPILVGGLVESRYHGTSGRPARPADSGTTPPPVTLFKALADEKTLRGVLTMADRVLRGSRLGAVSYETDRNHDLAPRQVARYRTDNGEEFDVPFADDAEIPGTWLCRNGMEGTLIEGDLPEPKKVKPPRTHWHMLLERRSVEELDELLKERLDLIKTRRRGS